jgi:putative transposase
MQFEPNTIYHIYNQGNNRQNIFHKDDNYIFFLQKMRKELLPQVEFLACCLMPNHFHWLVLTKESACLPSNLLKAGHRKSSGDSESPDDYIQNLSNAIAILLRSYTRAINKQENTSGSLFRGKTKAKNRIIDCFITIDGKNKNLFFRPDNHYARTCFEYIRQNPVEAKMCGKAVDWRYSSAKDYEGLRNGTLCNQVLAKQLIFWE